MDKGPVETLSVSMDEDAGPIRTARHAYGAIDRPWVSFCSSCIAYMHFRFGLCPCAQPSQSRRQSQQQPYESHQAMSPVSASVNRRTINRLSF